MRNIIYCISVHINHRTSVLITRACKNSSQLKVFNTQMYIVYLGDWIKSFLMSLKKVEIFHFHISTLFYVYFYFSSRIFINFFLFGNARYRYKTLTAPLICTPFNRICWMQSGFTDNSTVPFNFKVASPWASGTDVTDVPSKSYTYVCPSWYALFPCTEKKI